MKPLSITLVLLTSLALCSGARAAFAPPMEGETDKRTAPTSATPSNNQNGSDPSVEERVADIAGRYTVIAAVLGLAGVLATALLGLIGVVITARMGRAKTQEKRNALTDAVAASLEESIVNKIEAIQLEVTILDLTGRVSQRVKYDNLRITREGTTLKNFPGLVSFSPPSSKITKAPVVTLSEHLKADDSLRTSKVEINCPDVEGKRSCDFIVDIGGELNYGEKLSYEYQVEASNGAYMYKEDVEANAMETFRKEYWSFKVNGVIDELEIRVNFPEGYRPIARAGVWIGSNLDDKYIDAQELKRVESRFRQPPDSTAALFGVKKPLLGFTYAIYWVPLEKKQVEALMASQV